MSSSFQCRYGCGSWLHTDEKLKSTGGKLIPLDEYGQPHCCHLNPYFKRFTKWNNKYNVKAKAVEIQEIQKISDFALIQEAREKIHHYNSRLATYKLQLSVMPKNGKMIGVEN